MNILITGGTGFIGSRLALSSLEKGHRVKVLGKTNNDAEQSNLNEIVAAGGEVKIGSVRNVRLLDEVVQNVDLVFHLAAAQHEMNISDNVFYDINVSGTRNVLEACAAAGVPRVVHGSTIGVYGNMSGTIDENTPCNPTNIYGITKLEGERLALSFSDRLHITAIRIPETYGPGDRRLLKLFKTLQKNLFFMIGSGENLHHLIYIDDLIEGLYQASDNPEANGKVYVLAGPSPLSTNRMVDIISNAVQSKGPRFRLPLFPFMMAAMLMEYTLRPMGIQPPLHRRRMDFFRKSYHFATQKAAANLGFEPGTQFDDGVAQTADWYQQQGLLPASSATSVDDKATPESIRVDRDLAAQIEPFDTFWEAPEDVEKGYDKFAKFYKRNYFKYLPSNKSTRTLVISCGTGYFVELLQKQGYSHVLGIDSDQGKIDYAASRGLNCQCENAFPFLKRNLKLESFELIIAEQEINHLTKEEIIKFLSLCRSNLTNDGKLIVHSLNGANPITGSEAQAQNFNHYNTLTEYSLKQILLHAGFKNIKVFPLNLYIFYNNPLNYVGMLLNAILNLSFRIAFIFYGKDNKIFTKKIGAAAVK